MKKIYLFKITCVMLFLSSCSNYVDIVPKGQKIPSTVDDLAYMMTIADRDSEWDYSDVLKSADDNLNVMTDDIYLSEESGVANSFPDARISLQHLYTWAKDIYEISENDLTWNNLYHSNYCVNYVLNHISEVSPGEVYDRDDVKGMALAHRAFNYFILANIYGKQYDKATASSDLAVPLLLDADVNLKLPRATVQEVYDQIIRDCQDALKLLKYDTHTYAHIPGRAMVHALLSRVYLFQSDWNNAYNEAKAALAMKSDIVDYNMIFPNVEGEPAYGLLNYNDMFGSASNTISELFYYRPGVNVGYMSQDFSSILDRENDLRFRHFIGINASIGAIDYGPCNQLSFAMCIMTSEVELNLAESALRKTDKAPSEALAALESIRVKRIDAASYQPLAEDLSSEELFKAILKERRLETRFSLMRWFDLKRLNKFPETQKTLKRTVNGITYTLEPNSPRYVMPIPAKESAYNPNIIQNER